MKVLFLTLLIAISSPLISDESDVALSFSTLSGKGTKVWKKMKTKEDLANFSLFEECFQRNINTDDFDLTSDPLIPKKIHFMWIGPKPFPEMAKKTIEHWFELCPDFEINFWTDRARDPIHPKLVVRQVDESILQDMMPYYLATNNIGEKSDVLKMKIIFEEGGVYLDHDILMKQSFSEFHHKYDFYSGLLPTGMGSLNQRPLTRFSIFGAAPRHPILYFALEMTKANWDRVLALYPGEDETSQHNRTTHRGYESYHTAVYNAIQDPAFKGIVFPTGYFDEMDGQFGIYSHELMEGSWKAGKTMNEEMLFQKVKRLSKRLTYITIFSLSLILVNMCLLVVIMRRTKHPRKVTL